MKQMVMIMLWAAWASLAMGEPAAKTPTPPLGWNSFDSFGCYLYEEAAFANLEAFAKKLKPHGYEYFVVDGGWYGEYELQAGTRFPAEKHASDVRYNEFGHYLPSKTYFPNGLEALKNRTHELGLKFGVHLMRGVPRKAYEENLQIKGTNVRVRDIAITAKEQNCGWCKYNYMVDMTKPGAQEWYDGLIQHIADMGVDIIKYDDITGYPAEVEAVANAIKKTGKPIVLSLSHGGESKEEHMPAYEQANMLRITADVWDEERHLAKCFTAWKRWQPVWAASAERNLWMDLDMIPFGQLQLMNPPGKKGDVMSKGDVALAGKGTTRWCQLDKAGMRTFITMRALAASPLMMGGDLPTLDDYSLKLTTDPDMLACNQNGIMGHLVHDADGLEIWRTPKQGDDSKGWVGVFNRSKRATKVVLDAAQMGLKPKASLYDVWGAKAVAFGDHVELEPNDVLFLRVN